MAICGNGAFQCHLSGYPILWDDIVYHLPQSLSFLFLAFFYSDVSHTSGMKLVMFDVYTLKQYSGQR